MTLPLELRKLRRLSHFHPQDLTARYHVSILATEHECLCVCMCWLCVLRSTDISSNVVDISWGFEDLIPSVFEELCAGPRKTLGKMLQQSQQRGPAFRALLWTHPASPEV